MNTEQAERFYGPFCKRNDDCERRLHDGACGLDGGPDFPPTEHEIHVAELEAALAAAEARLRAVEALAWKSPRVSAFAIRAALTTAQDPS